MEYLSEFIWRKGARDINEDSLAISEIKICNQSMLLAVICDGIGGLAQGENASTFTVSRLKCAFEQAAREPDMDLRRMRHILSRQLYTCHRLLKEKGTEAGAPMGTTVCLALICGRRGYLMSNGDSRIYFGRRRLSPKLPDHTDPRGRLRRAIGVGSYYPADLRRIYFGPKDILLLCSDGFYRRNHLSISAPGTFSHLLTPDQMRGKLEGMYYSALNSGERDNCSAVVLWRNS